MVRYVPKGQLQTSSVSIICTGAMCIISATTAWRLYRAPPFEFSRKDKIKMNTRAYIYKIIYWYPVNVFNPCWVDSVSAALEFSEVLLRSLEIKANFYSLVYTNFWLYFCIFLIFPRLRCPHRALTNIKNLLKIKLKIVAKVAVKRAQCELVHKLHSEWKQLQ